MTGGALPSHVLVPTGTLRLAALACEELAQDRMAQANAPGGGDPTGRVAREALRAHRLGELLDGAASGERVPWPGGDAPLFVVLDISTAHVPEDEADRLRHGCGASIIPHEYGAFVRVPSPDEDDGEDVPYPDLPNVCEVLAYAAREGCRFVNFDRDGDEVAGLPVFDW